jgi:uncharacterized membrane protein YqjE
MQPAAEHGRGLGAAVKEISGHASTLVKLEAELARLELARKLARLRSAAIAGAVAAVLALFGLGIALAAAVLGLVEAFPAWLAALIVAGGVLLAAALLGVVALRAFKRGSPPVPERAIREAKRTREAIRNGAS